MNESLPDMLAICSFCGVPGQDNTGTVSCCDGRSKHANMLLNPIASESMNGTQIDYFAKKIHIAVLSSEDNKQKNFQPGDPQLY
jgi:hypothetical protein